MKTGTHVWIVSPRTEFSYYESRDVVRIKRIPGIVAGEVDEDETKLWVRYYGAPNHFSRPGSEYGIYRQQIDRAMLVEREPDFSDPLEFKA